MFAIHINIHHQVFHTTTYNLNPYDGDINTSTTDELKLFLKAAEENKLDTKLKISQSNVHTIIGSLSGYARKFGWDSLVNSIPTTVGGY